VLKKITLSIIITSLSISPSNAINYPTALIKDNSYNYIVNIYDEKTRAANCSGVVYESIYILTAAHCVVNFAQSEKIIVEKNNGEKRSVVAILGHSNYRGIFSGDDIGLLLINRKFNVSYIKVTNLNESEKSLKLYKEKLILAGYGLNENREESKSLATATQRDISDKGVSIIGEIFNKNKMIAAGKWERKIAKYSGACEGDSGGGLFTAERTPTLIGLVSFGSVDCANGEPTVYTKVGYYYPWIKESKALLSNSISKMELSGAENAINIKTSPYLRDLLILCEGKPENSEKGIIRMKVLAPLFEITNVSKGRYLCLVTAAGGIIHKQELSVI
jgi:secreted trypsin-like serine protease